MNRRFEYNFFNYFRNLEKLMQLKPLNLGGYASYSGGVGGPPGGFVGYLPQTRVAYDYSEIAASGVPASGISLLDNLNHIRYRIDVLESGAGVSEIQEDDIIVATNATVINFEGDVDVVDEGNKVTITINGLPDQTPDRIIIANSVGTVTTDDYLKFRHAEPGGDIYINTIAGSTKTLVEMETYPYSVYLDAIFTSVNTDDWGTPPANSPINYQMIKYGDYAAFNSYTAAGTEASPAGVSSGNYLSSFSTYGYYTGFGWNYVGSVSFVAIEDFTSSSAYGSKIVFDVGLLSGYGTRDIFALFDYRAELYGDLELASTYGAYFGDMSTDGSFRIIPSGSDLSLEERISGAWAKASVSAGNYFSTVPSGIQPYAANSTTLNTNLNADLVDNKHYGQSPWTGVVIVDRGGLGDFTSIKSACDYVATLSPSGSNKYMILVMPGSYTETAFAIPNYTAVVGWGHRGAGLNSGVASNGLVSLTNTSIAGGSYITMSDHSMLYGISLRCDLTAGATSNGVVIQSVAVSGTPYIRVVSCHIIGVNSSATYSLTLLKGVFYCFGTQLQGNAAILCESTGSSIFAYGYLFSGLKGFVQYSGGGGSQIVYTRFGSGPGAMMTSYDIEVTSGTVYVNNSPFKTYSGSVDYIERFRNNVTNLNEAVAATDIIQILKGAAGQSVVVSKDVDSSNNIHNQRSITAGTPNVFNEQGADIDFRIEGDTEDQLFLLDAGLDVVRLGDGDTNYTQWDKTGHQTMVGNARPWRDELGDAIVLQQVGTGVSRNSTEGSVDFVTAANLSDYIYTNVQLNHDKDLTASIYPHIHWWQAENNIPNFLLQYRWQVNGGTKTTGWTNLACNLTAFAYSAGTLNQICYSNPIVVPSGSAISDVVQFRILRDNANNSTVFSGSDGYTATVGITNFDLHFMINSLGSTDEYLK